MDLGNLLQVTVWIPSVYHVSTARFVCKCMWINVTNTVDVSKWLHHGYKNTLYVICHEGIFGIHMHQPDRHIGYA